MRVDFELRDAHAGVVRITSENWVARDGSEVLLEIHKVASRGGLLSKKSRWVVQLWSRETERGESLRRGCVTASTLVHAFSQASLDMKYGFLSVLSLEDAFED